MSATSDPNERIIGFVNEIGEHERHFNTITAGYKTMASSWLIAVFAAVGFIVAYDIEPRLLFVGGVGLAGGVGIYLLWLMDMRVYQQLLAANFTEGLRLEDEHKWLPQVRHNMAKSQLSGSVARNLSWFYIVGIAVPLVIFLFSIGSFLYKTRGGMSSYIFVILGGILLFFVLHKIRFSSKEEVLEDRNLKIIDKDEKEKAKKKAKEEKKRSLEFLGIGFGIYLIGFILLNSELLLPASELKPETTVLRKDFDYLAPDKSEIRLLFSMHGGGLAHCVLPSQAVTQAVEHKTVEEIWYVLAGKGEIWRRKESFEQIVDLSPQTCITIPVHTQFQFRNTGKDSLVILIATMPPWPGKQEAIQVKNFWPTQ